MALQSYNDSARPHLRLEPALSHERAVVGRDEEHLGNRAVSHTVDSDTLWEGDAKLPQALALAALICAASAAAAVILVLATSDPFGVFLREPVLGLEALVEDLSNRVDTNFELLLV